MKLLAHIIDIAIWALLVVGALAGLTVFIAVIIAVLWFDWRDDD